MIFELAFLLVGTYLLLKGSEWVTDSSNTVAGKLGTTNIAVGLIFVSIMLSLPELLVALSALIKGHEQISVGVSLGSIIVNLGLVLGITVFLKTIRIPQHVVTRDGVFMLVATLVVSLIALEDLEITQRDGLIFILLFIAYMINVYAQEKQLANKEKKKEVEALSKTLIAFGKMHDFTSVKNGFLIFIIGGILLLVGSELFTRGLIGLGTLFSISDTLLGITIGALGPSLPNLIVAIQASRKGFDELAISQSIGSNIFTLFFTLGVVALVQPILLPTEFGLVTAPALIIITLVSFVFLLKGKMGKIEGLILLGLYMASVLAELFL
ncbi:sodium:calcium antiporter [Candidatus Micrarchaeota archaeon]|nr:sodium:calcium antiporter [Candidatus Micrarchaeota archaeon]